MSDHDYVQAARRAERFHFRSEVINAGDYIRLREQGKAQDLISIYAQRNGCISIIQEVINLAEQTNSTFCNEFLREAVMLALSDYITSEDRIILADYLEIKQVVSADQILEFAANKVTQSETYQVLTQYLTDLGFAYPVIKEHAPIEVQSGSEA